MMSPFVSWLIIAEMIKAAFMPPPKPEKEKGK